MHPLISIPELFQLILNQSRLSSDIQSIGRLALACKALHEQALDELWKEQDRLDYLIRLLPGDAWEVVKLLKMSADDEDFEEEQVYLPVRILRDVLPAEWDRVILPYSRRIRTLVFCPEQIPHWSVLEQLTQYQDPTRQRLLPLQHYLFPNLRHLRWRTTDMFYTSLIYHFCGPRLRDVEIYVHPESLPLPDAPPRTPQDAIRALRLPWSQLERVSFVVVHSWQCMPTPGGSFTGAVVQLSACMTNLRLEGLDLEGLAHLGTLPKLESLQLWQPRVADLTRNLSERPYFLDNKYVAPSRFALPALKHLAINNAPIGYTAEIFRLPLSLPQLQRLELVVRDSWHNLESQFTDLFSLLAERLPPNLSDIRISDCYQPSTHSTWTVTHHRFDAATLIPLSALSQLTNVELYYSNGVSLNEATLSILAQAWPRLENLALQQYERRHWHTPISKLTLGSLETLARYCPRLKSLCLCFDASRPPPAAPFPATTPTELAARVRQDALTLLDVGRSEWPTGQDAATNVARYLSGMFPSLVSLRSVPAEGSSWHRVQKMLVLMADARRDERAWIGAGL
ncbi:F-box domain-containing protein [Mycena kentingensis (nom. inval.)]|nr:F-box domain-containing protein [Mycena kentingensis (nom. inval.)]